MLINPYVFGGYTPTDANAAAYIAAVEAADGVALEPAVRKAIDQFVIGCKADGIWTAIKASCILAGARTLTGALVPLAGTAPTNNNFASGDYNRKTGLKGDASTKYLDSNRNNNVDGQNDKHMCCYISEQYDATGSGSYWYMGITESLSGSSVLGRTGGGSRQIFCQINCSAFANATAASAPVGFHGVHRISPLGFRYRVSSGTVISVNSSETPRNETISIFRGGTVFYSGQRIAFYSIGSGTALTTFLDLMDSRVTTLINAIAAAIP